MKWNKLFFVVVVVVHFAILCDVSFEMNCANKSFNSIFRAFRRSWINSIIIQSIQNLSLSLSLSLAAKMESIVMKTITTTTEFETEFIGKWNPCNEERKKHYRNSRVCCVNSPLFNGIRFNNNNSISWKGKKLIKMEYLSFFGKGNRI